MITTERFTKYVIDQVVPHLAAVSIELVQVDDLLGGYDDFIDRSFRNEVERHLRAARATLSELSEIVFDTFGFAAEREPVYLRVPGVYPGSPAEAQEGASARDACSAACAPRDAPLSQRSQQLPPDAGVGSAPTYLRLEHVAALIPSACRVSERGGCVKVTA